MGGAQAPPMLFSKRVYDVKTTYLYLEKIMRNSLRFILMLFMVLSFLMTTEVASALAASERVTFLGAKFIVGKGWLVTLKVSEGTDTDQPVSVIVNGDQYTLDCKTAESNGNSFILTCLAAVPRASVGAEATIWFGSDSFITTVKEGRPWCYSVFDFGPEGWGPIGTYCQVHTAAVGDLIKFFNPDYPAVPFWIYRYDLDSSHACNGHSPDFGDGYYFIC